MSSSTDRDARSPAAGPPDLPEILGRLPWLVQVTLRGEIASPRSVEVPADSVTTSPDGAILMTGRAGSFAVEATWRALVGDGGWAVTLEVGLDPAATGSIDAAVAVALRVPANRDPRWLIPGVFYGENRPAASNARYPRWVPDPAAGDDPFAASAWWLRSDRAATPAVLASGGGRRIALATAELSAAGPTGVGFGTVGQATDRGREIRLSFPYREEPVVYDGSPEPLPPDRPTHCWEPGSMVRLAFRAYLRADDHDADREILRDVHGWLADRPLRPALRIDEAAALAAEGLMRWHFRPSDGVLIETAGFDRGSRAAARSTTVTLDDEPGSAPGDRLAMHVAWLSGAPAAAALVAHGLRLGQADLVAAGRRVLDEIAGNRAPCGTFWGQWSAEAGWGKGWTAGPDAVHGRTAAEATLFMTRAARSLGTATASRPSLWRDAVASNLAWIVANETGGAVPTDWNGRTGQPLSFAGTSGLAWVPALVEAASLLGDAGHLEVAGQIAAHHARDVDAGFLYGAPEDVDLGPTSEDGYVAVQAYVALARVATGTDAERWLGLARRAADWMLTFRFSYDVAFPPDTILGRLGFQSRGADLASPANQHLHAYGLICTRELAELSRRTADPWYLERARETLACFRQVIATTDGELGAMRGMAPERLYQTRYDGRKGEIGRLSHAWCLGLLLDAAEAAIGDPAIGDPAIVAGEETRERPTAVAVAGAGREREGRDRG